jgi:ribosomal protein S18 acetylase RimI-like enzyme
VRFVGGTEAIRERRGDDLDACVELARVLRRGDGYPSFLPDDDFGRFLSPANLLGAYVADVDGEVVGHVAMRTSSAPTATEVATRALGVEAERLGFVSRLMVHPSVRRRGVARRLLGTAAGELARLGRVVVLDVLTKDRAAIALYEREGWELLGRGTFTARSGGTFDELVYRAPASPGIAD